jgi:ABC-type transporter Mla MlaB component
MATKTTKRKRASAPAALPAAPPSDVVTEITAAPEPEREIAAAAPESVEAANMEVVEPASAIGEPMPAAEPSAARIGLSSHCTVKDATGLKNELLRWLDEPGSVAIDANSVERIDTAVVQLLCAFVRERAERKLGVTWTGATPSMLDAARLLGVRTLLALPTEAAP